MGEILSEQWALLILGVLAMTFNIYHIEAGRGKYTMGTLAYRFGQYFEFLNWLVLLGIVVYLSYSYTWWLLFSFFVFPLVGAVLTSILGGWATLVYLVGMPVFAVVAVVLLLV